MPPHEAMDGAYDKQELFRNGAPNRHANGHAGGVQGGVQGGASETGVDQVRKASRLLWRHKWLFLVVALLVAGAAAAYTYSLPKVYRTSSLLLVEPDRSGAGQISLQMRGASAQRGSALANDLLVINQSKDLAQRVAQRLLEMQTFPETNDPMPMLNAPGGHTLSAAGLAGRVRGATRAYSAGQQVDAVRIGATSTNPRMASTLANVYSEEYIAWARRESRADVRNSREFLQGQADRMRGRLDSLENRLSDYMRENDAAALDQEASRTVQQIATLEAQRDEARIQVQQQRAALQAKQDEIDRIEPQLADRAASNVGAELRRVREELTQKEATREQAYARDPSLRENPDPPMQRLNRDIEQLRERRDSLSEQSVNETLAAGGIGSPSGGEGGGSGAGSGAAYVAQQRREVAQSRIALDGLEAKINTLNSRIAEYRRKRERIPEQSIELAQLQRARQSTEKLYTFIIERLQETRVTEQSEVGYAQVLNPAGVPGLPFKPDTRRNLIMGLMLGLLLGGGLVFLREKLDVRLRRPNDLKQAGHDMAGVIPDLTPLIEEDFGGAETITVDGTEFTTDLPMLLSPMSGAAESFRRLRNTIQFSRPDTVVQALMVTSAHKGDGKTTVALNTAIAMAQADRRTLVVDADLHRPRVHRALGQQSEPGLTDVLFGRSSFKAACTATDIDHFDLLPAGREVPKPAELLGSGKMRAFIQKVREEYDFIVFDTPPVGALSDAMLLATQCEGTLLVARASQTDGRAFAQAATTLGEVGAPILGAVLNGFDPKREGYGYQDYNYSYGYGYGGGRAGYGTRSEERESLTPSST